MKRSAIFMLLLCAILVSYGQTITLTFQAKDSLNQAPITLDSVIVTNLTENCDTTLYGAVCTLVLPATWPTGIQKSPDDAPGSFFVLQNIPNPFIGSTTVKIYLKHDLTLSLGLFDNAGKTLSELKNFYTRGWHEFSVTSDASQPLFLHVTDNVSSSTVRMISLGSGNGAVAIRYMGHTNDFNMKNKSSKSDPAFNFYLGNQMQYQAYAFGYARCTMMDQPVADSDYSFPMVFDCGDAIVSYEGKEYNTVKIGTQCWFAQNVDAGTKIDGLASQTDNGIIEKYCSGNLDINCTIYGGLYQWDEAMLYTTTAGARGFVLPDGIFLPKKSGMN